jgi:hypothetical protein
VPLGDLELLYFGMHEAEFAARVLSPELGVSSHRRTPVRTALDDGDLLENTPTVVGARLDRFDHQPLVRKGRAHLAPTHASR